MAADLTASFGIQTDAPSGETDALAVSLEQVYDRMVADQKAVSDLNAAMRRLKGDAATTTDSFKALKEELQAKKVALASSQVSFQKMGGSMTDASKRVADLKAARASDAAAAQAAAERQAAAAGEQKKAQEALAQKLIADAQKKGQEAIKLQSKQREEAKKELDTFLQNQRKKHQERTKEHAAELKAKKEGLKASSLTAAGENLIASAATSAAGIAAKAMMAIYAAIAAAAAAFVYFGIQAANAARAARLLREATTGSAAGAKELDRQVSALASRLPGTRAEIEEIGLALVRAQIGGPMLEHAFAAVATAAQVMGSQAGSIIQGLVERAKQSKRFILGAFDLKGTGLATDDVVRALAARLKVSFAQAKAALQNGQVGMEVGVAALNDALQARFGDIGKKMSLGLDKQFAKAQDNLGRLFKDVRFDGFLEGLASVLSLLDENTATGQALKAIVEVMLNPLLDFGASSAPGIKAFFQGAIIGALILTISLLKLKKAFKEAIGPTNVGQFDPVKMFMLGAMAVDVFAAGLMRGVRVAVFMVQVVAAVASAIGSAYDVIASVDLGEIGINIVRSLADAIAGAKDLVVEAAKKLASAIPAPIRKILGIASPSKVMRGFGRDTSKGLALGVDDGTDEVEAAAEAMARKPVEVANRATAAGRVLGEGSSKGSGGGGPTVININGVKDAEKLTEMSFWDRVADVLDRARSSGGAVAVEVTA